MKQAVIIADAMVMLVVNLIGFRPAHSYRRNMAQMVAEKRLRPLPGKMSIVSPVRQSEWNHRL